MRTTSPDAAYEMQLEVFRRQVEEAAQFLYVAATINERASLNRDTLNALNLAPGFWVTVSGGLQMAAIVAVGRIFDPNPPHHTVDTLLWFAEQHLQIFSKDALATRKRRAGVADRHVPDILQRAHVPNAADFHRLGRRLRGHRRTYQSQFKDIRHLHLAHTVVIDSADLSAMYGKTRRRDLERLIVFLTQLHDALWHLFHNGLRPTLRRMPWSSRALFAGGLAIGASSQRTKPSWSTLKNVCA